MKALVAIVSLPLAACATTPHSIRQLPPKAEFTSARSASELEQCLAESKLSLLGGPTIVHGPARTTLAYGTGGITSLMIDVAPPNVTVRSGYPFTSGERRWLEACL